MDILKRLVELQNQRGWTDYGIAKEAGLSPNTVSNIYRRNNVPSKITLEVILLIVNGIIVHTVVTMRRQRTIGSDFLTHDCSCFTARAFFVRHPCFTLYFFCGRIRKTVRFFDENS